MTGKTPQIRAGVGTTPPGQLLLEARLHHAVATLSPLTLRRYRGAAVHFLQRYKQFSERHVVLADLHPIAPAGYHQALNELTAHVNHIDQHAYA